MSPFACFPRLSSAILLRFKFLLIHILYQIILHDLIGWRWQILSITGRPRHILLSLSFLASFIHILYRFNHLDRCLASILYILLINWHSIRLLIGDSLFSQLLLHLEVMMRYNSLSESNGFIIVFSINKSLSDSVWDRLFQIEVVLMKVIHLVHSILILCSHSSTHFYKKIQKIKKYSNFISN